jgi:hypothetical protein
LSPIVGMAISPDNQYLLATGWGQGNQFQGDDGRDYHMPAKTYPVQLQSLVDYRVTAELELPGDYPGPIGFSRDSRTVALAVNNDEPHIDLRKIPDLAETGRIDLPCRALALEFSASDKLLAVSLADCTILICDLQDLARERQN